jgi:hypothetical protein
MKKSTYRAEPSVQRVWETRREIARGAFETPERVGGAIERLLEMLPPEPVPPVPQRGAVEGGWGVAGGGARGGAERRTTAA